MAFINHRETLFTHEFGPKQVKCCRRFVRFSNFSLLFMCNAFEIQSESCGWFRFECLMSKFTVNLTLSAHIYIESFMQSGFECFPHLPISFQHVYVAFQLFISFSNDFVIYFRMHFGIHSLIWIINLAFTC